MNKAMREATQEEKQKDTHVQIRRIGNGYIVSFVDSSHVLGNLYESHTETIEDALVIAEKHFRTYFA